MIRQKHNNKLKNRKVRTVFYEPIAPYFAGTYNTLISIVQGVSLGALLYFVKEEPVNYIIIFKCILTFLIICFIWHKYVTHNQYLAWRLSIFDTIIPMGFAVIQFLLILSIRKTAYSFSLCMMGIYFWGFVAYLNSALKQENSEVPKLYKEHFACIENRALVEKFRQEIKAYSKYSLILMLSLTAVFGVFTFVLYSICPCGKELSCGNKLCEGLYDIPVIVLTAISIFVVSCSDLPKKLKNLKN